METKIKIENVDNNLFNSDLLSLISDICKDQGNDIEVTKKSIPGTKGEIITAILVGIAANLLTDIIKTAISNLINHQGYNPKNKIRIEKKTFEIGDLLLNK